MKRAKFEGRMNEVMLVATKAAQNEDGTTDPRNMKVIGLMREALGYTMQMNYEIECLKKEIKVLKKNQEEKRDEIGAQASVSFLFSRKKTYPLMRRKTHFKEDYIMKNLIKKVFLGMAFAIPFYFYFSNLA